MGHEVSKSAAMQVITEVLVTREGRLYEYQGLQFLAMKGDLDRLHQVQAALMRLGVVSWVVKLNHKWRLASTQSRLLKEMNLALNHPALLETFNFGDES